MIFHLEDVFAKVCANCSSKLGRRWLECGASERWVKDRISGYESSTMTKVSSGNRSELGVMYLFPGGGECWFVSF